MGNFACNCCGGDESSQRDKELDQYINRWHRDQSKMAKFDKKDFLLSQQDFGVKTFVAGKVNEILDEISKKQDINTALGAVSEELLMTMAALTNEGGNLGSKTRSGQSE